MATTVQRTTADQVAIEQLAHHYALRNPADVATFVETHPEVIAPLLAAVDVVPRYFGPEATLALEVERDREARDHEQLFALMQTDLAVDAAIASLDRFDEEWWLDALVPAASTLIFSVEHL